MIRNGDKNNSPSGQEKRLLILGFGRMGVSHALQVCGILNARDIRYRITVVDPSIMSKIVAFSLYRGRLSLDTIEKLTEFPDDYFDFAIDASPPYRRSENVQLLEKISRRYLIEKPVREKIGRNGMSGYVLQHNPLVEKLAPLVSLLDLQSIDASLKTNLRFDKGTGWRSGPNGGVINEFLGHLLSIPLACRHDFGLLQVKTVRERSGLVEIEVDSSLCPLRIKIEYGNKNIRKSSYQWNFSSKNSSFIEYDCYHISSYRSGLKKYLSLVDIGTAAEFYLRGFDFCAQAQALLDGRGDKIGREDLGQIDTIIEQVLQYE